MSEQLTRADVPDALWPTDNVLDIPVLDLSMQADAVDLPVTRWGQRARRNIMRGTYHFYTDDAKFDPSVWKSPAGVVNSQCVSVVEPNFSCYEQMPRAVALWHIYRKRWLARWWQSQGIRVFVDLNVAACHDADNLLGVPAGWRAYATRGYSDRIDRLYERYELACERAGGSVLFLVYSGGRAVREAAERWGWVHIRDDADAAGRRTIPHVAEGFEHGRQLDWWPQWQEAGIGRR